MDTFVDSSWYQLRYISPDYRDGPFDPEALRKWTPVDQYTGGAEHAVMHLLYARFFTKALRDLGLVDFDEPFKKLFNQGHIIVDKQKMSKSRGNVVSPDEYVAELGADVVRCYLMFIGPWDQGGEWSDSGINGMARWTNRVWELAHRDARELDAQPLDSEAIRDTQRLVHQTIRRVSDDLDRFKFNTALAGLMEYTNSLNQVWEHRGISFDDWNDAVAKLLVMMAPMAPHLAEELWEHAGNEYSVHNQLWPGWDPDLGGGRANHPGCTGERASP